MCGICGIAVLNEMDRVDPSLVVAMSQTMLHRGPDDGGLYSNPRVALGHRRLSIIDLSSGKQPISNEDGSVWVVFNGEIYNYRELRQDLLGRGHAFATNTDTEVIVHLYEEHGEEFVSHLQGMFAIALWDDKSKKLVLVRDRLGIKPLYYSVSSRSLSFASELKALLQDPAVQRIVDPGALDTFLTYLYTPARQTLLSGIHKLEPGHFMTLQQGVVKDRQYWDLKFGLKGPRRSFMEATDQLIELLRETVRHHMISDVPVGVLLSGGVDSTGLLSFIAEEAETQICTFTVGFGGEGFADERPYAKLAAERFGTRHYETTISLGDFRDFLPRYVWHMEEPICEPPAVALYYVTKLARGIVKVLISGEGGDEAFAGYQNYRNLKALEQIKVAAGPLSRPLGAVLEQIGHSIGFGKLERYARLMKYPLSHYYYSRTSGPFSYFNSHKDSLYSDDFKSLIAQQESASPTAAAFRTVQDESILNQMLYVDTKTWLPDDLLIKADKMTMANSVELRVPLLDHKVLEFAAGLPTEFKVRGMETKRILKKALEGRIPKEIIQRKKTGFPVPIESWIRNGLGSFVRDVLLDRRTTERPYFRKEAVQALLARNAATGDCAAEVFSLVTLELWHRAFVDAQN